MGSSHPEGNGSTHWSRRLDESKEEKMSRRTGESGGVDLRGVRRSSGEVIKTKTF